MADHRDLGSDLPRTYLHPPKRRMVTVLTIAAAVTLVVAATAFALGFRRLASPGPLARGHAAFGSTCAECHTPWVGATDGKCERCHDEAARGRFRNDLHAKTARDQHIANLKAGTSACRSCHDDHRGAAFELTSGSSSECTACHRFSWKDHPDFAPVVNGRAEPPGIKFSHTVHLPEEEKSLQKGCEGCHVRAADARHFEPIAFDKHCAACHLRTGVKPWEKATDAHYDETLVARAAGLIAAIDPTGLQAERSSIGATIERLEQELRTEPSPLSNVPAPSARDKADRQALSRALDRLRGRLAQVTSRTQAGSAAREGLGPRAQDELTAILKPCTTCHVVASNRMLPMLAARPPLTMATFTHEPHAGKQKLECQSCHVNVDRSGDAADVNLPHVTRCRECHGKEKAAPTSCLACHRYHRSPNAPLAAWTPAGII